MTGPLFTFDDGPSIWTMPIVRLLDRAGLQGLFFVTGQQVLAPGGVEILRQLDVHGHRIGVHGWTHRRLTEFLTEGEIRNELSWTQELVTGLTGTRPVLFRAPYYGTSLLVNEIALSMGMTHVDASLIPDDWCATDPEALAAVILSELQPDSVVSLHDGIPPDGGSSSCTQDRLVTIEALRLVLEGMRA